MNRTTALADPPSESRLDAVLADYLDRLDRGERIDRAQLLAGYPDLAAEIEAFLATADRVEAMAGPSVAETTAGLEAQLGTSHPGQPAGPREPIALPRQFGRYEILELLGQGAMGDVFLARDASLNRLVAIKIHCASHGTPEAIERFRREAQAAAGLRHLNICPIHDIGQLDGHLYISMAHIEGRSLAEELAERPLPAARQAARIIRQLALALAEAHRAGIVHRDLKPKNVMIDAAGEPILTDFGLARRLDQADAELTRSGQIVGTPAYMSPEQLDAAGEVGPASDIFSLGVIFYEMLAGRRAFQGSLSAVLAQIVCGAAPPPSSFQPGVDRGLEAICRRMMRVERPERYGSMAEVAADLSAWLDEQSAADHSAKVSSASLPPPVPPPVPQPKPAAALPQIVPAAKPAPQQPAAASGFRWEWAAIFVAAAAATYGLLLAAGVGTGNDPAAKAPERPARQRPPAAPVTEPSIAPAPLPKPEPSSPAPRPEPPASEATPKKVPLTTLPPLKVADEIQRLITERAKAGEFGSPTDWKQAAEFGNAEARRRQREGQLAEGIEIRFQPLSGGIAVGITGRAGGAPAGSPAPQGGVKGGGVGGGGFGGGGFGGGGVSGGGFGGGATQGGGTGGGSKVGGGKRH